MKNLSINNIYTINDSIGYYKYEDEYEKNFQTVRILDRILDGIQNGNHIAPRLAREHKQSTPKAVQEQFGGAKDRGGQPQRGLKDSLRWFNN